MRKNSYRKYNIFFVKKAVLVPVLSLLTIIFLFIFSCDANSDSAADATGNDTDSGQTAEEMQETGQEENNNAGEGTDTGEETGDDEETPGGDILVNVYYLDSMGEYLVGEARMVSSENKYTDALYELMKLPVDSSLFRLVPDSTKINSVTVEEGLAEVDFSMDFIEDKITSDVEDNLLIYSIVNTLTEFSEINSVTFFIDGEKLDTLGELDLSEPYFRRVDLIKE